MHGKAMKATTTTTTVTAEDRESAAGGLQRQLTQAMRQFDVGLMAAVSIAVRTDRISVIRR